MHVLSTDLRSAYILHTKFAQFSLFRDRAQIRVEWLCAFCLPYFGFAHIDARLVGTTRGTDINMCSIFGVVHALSPTVCLRTLSVGF